MVGGLLLLLIVRRPGAQPAIPPRPPIDATALSRLSDRIARATSGRAVDFAATAMPVGDLVPDPEEAHRGGRTELRRAAARCAPLLPEGTADLEWQEVDSFEPDGSGGAELVDRELDSPAAHDAFHSCVTDEIVGQLVVLPAGVGDGWNVRRGGRFSLDSGPAR